ncbi:putative protein C2E12,03c [Schizosaccharomyces pombe 972h-] [Rhizoctonia solani]|uniref:Uncharacterized protein n=1 Tax=Rhizoctonia solani TaxID=456999 RepID=A0A0K6G3B3_9AGAM|nr:putative protein C2E12,03c [Schizosaccharomyces pombe 972h-] [Rhizoctonia solani]
MFWRQSVSTVMWMVQLVPQVIKSYREKSTEGLSPWLMLSWALSAPFLGVYMIAQEISIPLILQPQLFGAMSALSWTQCLYYSYHKTKIQCLSAYCIFLTFAGAFQGGFAVLARRKYENGDVWSLRTFALFSSILLSAGLLPQYWEIWKRKEVIGVSILFMIIDMLGGVFSALSLVFKETFDIFAAIPYLMVVALDALVIVLAMILNPLARRRRQRQESNEIAVEAQRPTDERDIPQRIITV